MNKFTAIGRIIREPEFRQAGGVEVCDFPLSVRTRGKNDQGYPNAIIVKCTLWRKLAELARNFGLYKGQNVGVSGKLDMEFYTDKNGVARTNLVLDVEDIDFIRQTDMPVKSEAPAGDADDSKFVGGPTNGMVTATDAEVPF